MQHHLIRTSLPFALVAALSLAACSQEPETFNDTIGDPQAAALANAATVAPPPMIQASRSYRCKDNSLIYIDFMTNNTANYRTDKSGPVTVLTASADGEPYVSADGSQTLTGTGDTVTFNGQSCKAG